MYKMSKTRQQKAGEQASIDSFMRKEDSQLTNSEIKQMFESLQKNQTLIRESIENKNKEDDSRLTKNEKTVEATTQNVNRILENLDRIIPRMGDIELRLSGIEEKLDTMPDLERNIDFMEDMEQVLPRMGSIEDRMKEIEDKLEERVKYQERLKDLEEKALWEELERKKQNLIVYGLKGSETADQSIEVAKGFMKDSLKLDAEWVENLQLKAAMRLQGNGKGPLPLKLCFMWPKDRDTCLRAGYNLKGTNLSLRTDLPKSMRIKRAKLATKAYGMKKRGEVVATKIREKGITICLEVKDNEGDKWRTVKEEESK